MDFPSQVPVKLGHDVVHFVLVQQDVGQLEDGAELRKGQVAVATDIQLAESSAYVLPVSSQLCTQTVGVKKLLCMQSEGVSTSCVHIQKGLSNV